MRSAVCPTPPSGVTLPKLLPDVRLRSRHARVVPVSSVSGRRKNPDVYLLLMRCTAFGPFVDPISERAQLIPGMLGRPGYKEIRQWVRVFCSRNWPSIMVTEDALRRFYNVLWCYQPQLPQGAPATWADSGGCDRAQTFTL